MLEILIAVIAIVVLLGAYIAIQGVKKKRKGDDKLINRSVPPLDPDNKKAGGGTPRETYPGSN